jgi:hypothetical protein
MTNDDMQSVSHTHPYTGETFGTVYRRGPAVADGGESPSRRDTTPADEMKDVDHTPPHGDGANDVWERGSEHTDDDEEDVDRVVEVTDE